MSIGETLRAVILVRRADNNKEPVREWLEANRARNDFDPSVLDYPQTKILAAHTNGTVHAYMPVQPVGMLESVGINPSSSPLEVANSMIELVKAAAVLASDGNIRELYFLSSDAVTAGGAELMGFEKMPHSVYRMRLT